MEIFGKIFSWLVSLPLWLRAVVLMLVAALVLCLTFTGCGLTRAVVTNRADGTKTTISISTNNPTSVDASPDVQLKFSE